MFVKILTQYLVKVNTQQLAGIGKIISNIRFKIRYANL